MELTPAIDALKALAQDSRLTIFRALVQAGGSGLAVGTLRAQTGLPGATLSNHLNVLRQAGLIRDQREGRSIRCCADYERMNGLIAFLTENCCGVTLPGATPLACVSVPCLPSAKKPRKRRIRK